MKRAGHEPAAAWIAAAAFMAAVGIWHVPAAFDWALRHPLGHALEHLMLIATAIAFWRVVLTSGRRRLSPGVAVLMVSLVGTQGAFMGALISFAPHPLYAAYAGNSLDDQALAGVMMCIPASLIYLSSTGLGAGADTACRAVAAGVTRLRASIATFGGAKSFSSFSKTRHGRFRKSDPSRHDVRSGHTQAPPILWFFMHLQEYSAMLRLGAIGAPAGC